jgi:hypothetical protein
MPKVYTVRINGYPIKDFSDEVLAKKFMVDIHLQQMEKVKALAYIDEAVLKSDMKEAKEVLKYIMEK